MIIIMIIRKNFFNIVILCGPSRAKSKVLLKLIRPPCPDADRPGDGRVGRDGQDQREVANDAGVAMMSAYNYIAGAKEPYDALALRPMRVSRSYPLLARFTLCLAMPPHT